MWYLPLIIGILCELLANDWDGIRTIGQFIVAWLGIGFLSLVIAIVAGLFLPEYTVTIDTVSAILLYFVFSFIGLIGVKIARYLGKIEIK